MWQVWLKMFQWFWRRFLKVLNVFLLLPNYLPFKNGVALHLNKLDSLSPKNALCQFWLKLARWFWRRRFLKVVNLFLLFPNYLPFEKDLALHLNILESPSPGDTLCQVWLKLAQWSLRRRWKCEKFTDRRTDRQTDNGQQVIRTAHLSFQLRWAKEEMFFRNIKNWIFSF